MLHKVENLDLKRSRVCSIDVFRGIVMLGMVFVNDIGSRSFSNTQNVAVWLKHARVNDTIYFADVVFPAFIFIVGLSIPFAIAARWGRGESNLRIWKHILLRFLWLAVTGILMGNMWGAMQNGKGACIGIGFDVWCVLLLLGFVLVWMRYPSSEGMKRVLYYVLRGAGILLVVWMAAVFRENIGGDMRWLKVRWAILGRIGWAYVLACIVYFVFRRQPAGILGCMALAIALHIGDKGGVFDRFGFLDGVRSVVTFHDLIGSGGVMSLCGLFVGVVFVGVDSERREVLWMVLMAAGLYFGGSMLRGLYEEGIRKTTPAYLLYCGAICCVVYAFIYWLVDVRGFDRWTGFVKVVGQNPLLIYFMSFGLHPLLRATGVHWLNDHFNSGWVGVGRGVMVTFMLGAITVVLSKKWKVRVRL